MISKQHPPMHSLPDHPPAPAATTQSRRIFWIASVFLVACVINLLVNLYLIWRIPIWQTYMLLVTATIMTGLTVASLVFSRRGQIRLSASLLIAETLLVGPILAAMIADLGLVAGIGMLLVVSVGLIQALPAGESSRAIAAAAVSALICGLLDFWSPLEQISIPLLQGLIPAFIVGLITLYGLTVIRQFRHYNLHMKLILASLITALVPLALLGLVTYNAAVTSVTIGNGNGLKNIANTQALAVGDFLARQSDKMQSFGLSNTIEKAITTANESYVGTPAQIQANIALAEQHWLTVANDDPLVQSRLTSPLSQELARYRYTFSDNLEVLVTDRYGALVAATSRTEHYNFSLTEWWQASYNGGRGRTYISIGPPEFAPASTTEGVIVAVPIFAANFSSEAIGVLRTTYRLKALFDLLAATQGMQIGSTDLLLPDGRVLSGHGYLYTIPPDLLASLRAAAAATYVELEYEGEPALVSQSPVVDITGEAAIKSLNWVVIARQNQRDNLAIVEGQTRNVLLVILVVTTLAAGSAIVLAQLLTRPMKRLTAVARQVTAGDLSATAPVESGDEIGVLATAFNAMTAQLAQRLHNEQNQRERLIATVARYVAHMAEVERGNLATTLSLGDQSAERDDPLIVLGLQLNETTSGLRQMITQTRDAADALSAAVTEILAATAQQATGASEQSAAIAQTTTTVDEVKTISEQAILRAQEMADRSQRTVAVSQAGQKSVQETIESMNQIKERVESIAENILVLSEKTQQIGAIIATVNDIATQSNILALNAAIEAERAGEHGKGFAVVAAEVRNLAAQSKQATAQVKAILTEIQKATNTTVMATEEGAKGVDRGVQLAAQTGEAIRQLAGAINESAQAATQVVAGGRQQAAGIEQIALAMQHINQATVQSLASTRQAEKAAKDLSELAHRLSETVAQYKL